MIRVISNKALGFRNGDDNSIITVQPLVIREVPDWVEKDPIFKWALADGTIQKLDDSNPNAIDDVIDSQPTGGATQPSDSIETMTVEQLKALAAERNVEVPAGIKKAELVEMLKGE